MMKAVSGKDWGMKLSTSTDTLVKNGESHHPPPVPSYILWISMGILYNAPIKSRSL